MVIQDDGSPIPKGGKIMEKQISVNGMIPYFLCLKLHHPVDFVGFICADIMKSSENQQVPCLQRRIGAVLLQHLEHQIGNTRSMSNQSWVHQIKGPSCNINQILVAHRQGIFRHNNSFSHTPAYNFLPFIFT